MYAIKGTTAAMRCRGYKYELGKTHKTMRCPILGRKGFHACLNPYDTLTYYGNNGRNRYFLVELGGIITDCNSHDSKVAASKITFIKEVSVDDFPTLYDEFIKDKKRLAKLKYKEGFTRIRKDGKWNFIDRNGKYISKEWFEEVSPFGDTFALVKKNEKWYKLYSDGNTEIYE